MMRKKGERTAYGWLGPSRSIVTCSSQGHNLLLFLEILVCALILSDDCCWNLSGITGERCRTCCRQLDGGWEDEESPAPPSPLFLPWLDGLSKISTGDNNIFSKLYLILTYSDEASQKKVFPPQISVGAGSNCSAPLGLKAAKALNVTVAPKSSSRASCNCLLAEKHTHLQYLYTCFLFQTENK